jgi:UDP-N-acetylglucosamine diphosphorylase/glucosamine-1-phosphate N-acetyltransferase
MTNDPSDVAIVILAAGLGTRMKSDKAKVLHDILGRPMISYVVDTARAVAGNNLVLVIGHQAEVVKKTVADQADVHFAYQEEQLGTGHAVMRAIPALSDRTRHVVVLCGDVPLLRRATLQRFVDDHLNQERTLSVLAVELDNPTGYGRIVCDRDGNVKGIVEEADATAEQKAINLVNTGIYCVDRAFLESALRKIRPNNAQGEYYLTDIVGVAHRECVRIGVTIGGNPDEFMGVNSRAHLEAVERMMRQASDMN